MQRAITFKLFAYVLVGGFAIASKVTAAPPESSPAPASNVNVVNSQSSPVPVTLQGTGAISGNVAVTNTPSVTVSNTPSVNIANGALTVNPIYETQLLLDHTMSVGQSVRIPVAAYKTVHVDFTLANGPCEPPAGLKAYEDTTITTFRGKIDATSACDLLFPGLTLEMPGRSLLLQVVGTSGSTWRVVVFGRAN